MAEIMNKIQNTAEGIIRMMRDLRKSPISEVTTIKFKEARELLSKAWGIIANCPEMNSIHEKMRAKTKELRRLVSSPLVKKAAKEYLKESRISSINS